MLTTPEMTEIDDATWAMLGKLTKDLRIAAERMGRDEARYLVDCYYQLQDFRIRTAGQIRSQGEAEPCEFLRWLNNTISTLEKSLQSALGRYAKQWAVGAWCQSICGIGPVISAGLIAHIDIRRCKTFGQLWSFAGLNPAAKWDKGQKRPWNAKLKTLVAFKAGESFVKVQNNKNDFYGSLYRQRKDMETERNEAGGFSDDAARILTEKKIGKTTEAYKYLSQGMLPKAHIHARARRYAVKLFLSHLHHVMHLDYYGINPPIPYIFEHQGDDDNHRHYIEVPNLNAMRGRTLKEMFKE